MDPSVGSLVPVGKNRRWNFCIY